MGESLLWAGASPLMRAVSETNAARVPPDPALLARLWNPATCPVEALPHLAAAVGVAIWRPEWSEVLKRRVIARTIVLKRRRGTLGTFREMLDFVGVELVQLRAAPAICAPRVSLTQADRDAWAAQFPELRVYAVRQRHQRARVLRPGTTWGGARRFARATGSTGFAGRRATVVQGGVETDVRVDIVDGANQAGIPAQRRRFTPGKPLSRAVPVASTAADRIFTYSPGTSRLNSLPPGMKALDVAPKRIVQDGVRLSVVAPGRALFGSKRFLRGSPAAERIYDSVRIFDAARARAGKVRPRGGWILGSTQLGQAPFELQLAVDLSHVRAGRRPFPRLPGFVRAHDGTRTAEAIEAVRAAKLGRDKVLLRTGLSRPITANDALSVSGGFRVGQIIRSV